MIEYQKVDRISEKVTNFISKAMKNWKVELIAGRKNLSRGIFQGVSLSPLLIVIAMMPFNFIFRKYTGGYKFTKSQEKINHPMYMDDIKVFVKNEKEMKTLTQIIRIYSQYIGMEFSIEKCVMLIMKSGKKETMSGIELTNQESIKTLGEKEN